MLRGEVVAPLALLSTFATCVAFAASCMPSPDGGPVVIAPTVASSPLAVEPSAPEPLAVDGRSTAKADIAGTWREEFDGRSGCSDTITLSWVGNELHLDGANCEDGVAYDLEDVSFDGKELRFHLHVPKIDWVLDYHLTRASDDTLIGDAQSPGAEPHTVRWVRARAAPSP